MAQGSASPHTSAKIGQTWGTTLQRPASSSSDYHAIWRDAQTMKLPAQSESDESRRIQSRYRAYHNDSAAQLRWDVANPANQRYERELRDVAARALRRHVALEDARTLDVGCGDGWMLQALTDLGATPGNLHGIELRPNLAQQIQSSSPQFHIRCGNAERLDYGDAEFDMVIAFSIFSSILDDGTARRVAAEIARVLKPGGGVLWYDIRYPNPFNQGVRAMPQRRIKQLFPNFAAELESVVALPAVARRLGARGMWAYSLLHAVRPLRVAWAGWLAKPV